MATSTREAAVALRAIKRFRRFVLDTNVKHKRFAPEPPAATASTPSSSPSPSTPTPQTSTSTPPATATTTTTPEIYNPFLPWKNPKTGRWAPPQFSLRRQAELVKKARLLGADALALLPPGPKQRTATHADVPLADEPWTRPVTWTGVFEPRSEKEDAPNRLYACRRRMFKGHKWERTLEERTEKREAVMRAMGRTVRRYKSYTHRVKPNPLRRRGGKQQKLPF